MTENRVPRRSLSALYRASVRRDAAGVDAEELQALDGAGAVDVAVLERLARTPDAVAVHAIARVLPPWSNAMAAEIRRATFSPQDAATSRVRNWGWVSLAAAAGIAVCVVGLRQREQTEAMPQVAVQLPAAAADDVLFVDPDNAMIASVPAVTSDSIFIDSLDAAPSPGNS